MTAHHTVDLQEHMGHFNRFLRKKSKVFFKKSIQITCFIDCRVVEVYVHNKCLFTVIIEFRTRLLSLFY